MTDRISRRDALKTLGSAGVAAIVRVPTPEGPGIEIAVAPSGQHSVRVTVSPLGRGLTVPVPLDGALVQPAKASAAPAAKVTPPASRHTHPLRLVQRLYFNRADERSHRGRERTRRAATPDRSRERNAPLSDRRRAAARSRRRRPAVRPARLDRRDEERSGRLPAADARRPGAGAVARRHGRLGDVHPPSAGLVRLHGSGRALRSGIARSAARPFRRRHPRPGAGDGRIRAADRSSRDAAALVARLPAVAPHAGRAR